MNKMRANVLYKLVELVTVQVSSMHLLHGA